MAWRIHDSVVRGEIDNRQKNVVRGTLWIDGLAEAVTIELTGNACADLAGCRLTFTNPGKTVPLPRDASFALVQRGSIGDLTASRKVRVCDVPFEEADAMLRRGDRPPEHTANALYLEWFSEANGRVVVESAGYAVEVSPPSWHLSAADEAQRQAQATAGWRQFLARLDAAIEERRRAAPDPDKEWDEFDHERLLKESDARTEKYGELLDKYGHSEEAQERIEEEMGWRRELTEEEAEEQSRRIEEMNAACEAALNEPPSEPDPLREGIDWIRTPTGDVAHPLEHRCHEWAVKLWQQCRDLGLDDVDDEDLQQFLAEAHLTAAKLAGALGCIADGVAEPEPAFTVAYLKRALDHLHRCQAGLEAVAAPRSAAGSDAPLLPGALVADARRELFEIREAILRLMQELRSSR